MAKAARKKGRRRKPAEPAKRRKKATRRPSPKKPPATRRKTAKKAKAAKSTTPAKRTKAPKPAPAPAALATSGRQLARMVGKTHRAIQKWEADPAWLFGKISPENPVYAGHALEWNRQRRQATTGPAGSLRDVQNAKCREQMLKIRLERLIMEGVYHRGDECRARRLRQIHAVKQSLLDMGRSLAPRVLGETDVTEIERIIDEQTMDILREFAGDDHEEEAK